jgi:hypothetical protein
MDIIDGDDIMDIIFNDIFISIIDKEIFEAFFKGVNNTDDFKAIAESFFIKGDGFKKGDGVINI